MPDSPWIEATWLHAEGHDAGFLGLDEIAASDRCVDDKEALREDTR